MSDRLDDMLTNMNELRQKGEDFCLVTVVRTADATSAKAGAKALVTQEGNILGFVGGNCVQGAVRKASLAALEISEPRLIRVKPQENASEPIDVDGVDLYKSSCPSGGTVELFIEPFQQRMRLIICGASPVAISLLKIGDAMGYQTLHAAMEEDIDSDFPWVPLANFDLTKAELSKRDCVVVATQGKRDRQALVEALKSPAEYIAMIGSRKKIQNMKEQLKSEISSNRLSDLRGPAGLDLGAVDSSEIALSILSEILAFKRGRVVSVNRVPLDENQPEKVGSYES